MKMLPGVGVFGTGSSARVLVPLLRAEGFTVEALWGKTEEEAKQLAEEMNITFYTSRTDDVLLHQDVDLVCINIPPPLTRQISVKALGIGKNVVCEKAATSVDAFRMVTASRYYPQLMSLVGNVLRFLPAFVRMKQLIAEHYVGAVMICDARIYSGSLLSPNYGWICDELMGGGGLHTMGTYIVDLLTHLTGQRAEKVHGLLKTFVRQNAAIHGIRHVTSDDFCFFQMLMGGGVCSTVTLNFNMPGAFVHEVMVQALRQSFQGQGDRRTWDYTPVSMAAPSLARRRGPSLGELSVDCFLEQRAPDLADRRQGRVLKHPINVNKSNSNTMACGCWLFPLYLNKKWKNVLG
uniref:Glucose-fructose oxidoreductase domain-containing protein 2 n=1 Tax=Molossus molossus TaxID=27622 RepID=A0A7J8C7L5_MOLMO|nr:glucose-fructose oxidoreductase domain containing 2 [Molossus molossus]